MGGSVETLDRVERSKRSLSPAQSFRLRTADVIPLPGSCEECHRNRAQAAWHSIELELLNDAAKLFLLALEGAA